MYILIMDNLIIIIIIVPCILGLLLLCAYLFVIGYWEEDSVKTYSKSDNLRDQIKRKKNMEGMIIECNDLVNDEKC
jgi:hypothetical protein